MAFTTPTGGIPAAVALALIAWRRALATYKNHVHGAGWALPIADAGLFLAYTGVYLAVWRAPQPWLDALRASTPESATGLPVTTIAATRYLISTVD